MADINIQRKKTSPSPWLLVLLAAIVLAVAAYFFLRPDPADEPAPPAATPEAAAPGTAPDTLAAAAAVDQATRRAAIDAIPQGDSAGSTETASSLATQAASSPAAPDYARNGLQKLAGVLVALTDRDDLRDPAVLEQRDNLTSATARLDEASASLRPGFVAAAGLIQAMQQKAYPELESQANDLVSLAGQLSGRSATAAEQRQNQQFLTQAAAAVRVLGEPKN
ncbi:hypothetical protein MON38_21660 [Hymenobacter sp. DH14]|uniref:Uncharacterized protein n=1 Tax=Hymenobacter cyanobacteriorum TaxID=2926463 RepID=A0A9X1VIY9_9BACT|nr:hypothetical protein [Hymenobacter cyanobacteriorum]MCI1190039.1 hypothetical protein [Hymenobacter cyanobacteriorum]